jgi:hypothetical protein
MYTASLCGATFINAEFRALIKAKLENESYLATEDSTMASIVEGLTMAFENGEKKIWDYSHPIKVPSGIKIRGLLNDIPLEPKQRSEEDQQRLVEKEAMGLVHGMINLTRYDFPILLLTVDLSTDIFQIGDE